MLIGNTLIIIEPVKPEHCTDSHQYKVHNHIADHNIIEKLFSMILCACRPGINIDQGRQIANRICSKDDIGASMTEPLSQRTAQLCFMKRISKQKNKNDSKHKDKAAVLPDQHFFTYRHCQQHHCNNTNIYV